MIRILESSTNADGTIGRDGDLKYLFGLILEEDIHG